MCFLCGLLSVSASVPPLALGSGLGAGASGCLRLSFLVLLGSGASSGAAWSFFSLSGWLVGLCCLLSCGEVRGTRPRASVSHHSLILFLEVSPVQAPLLSTQGVVWVHRTVSRAVLWGDVAGAEHHCSLRRALCCDSIGIFAFGTQYPVFLTNK